MCDDEFAILSASADDGQTHLWHHREPNTPRRIFATEALRTLTRVPQSERFLASIAPASVAVFGLAGKGGKPARRCATPEALLSVVFGHDGQFLFAGGASGRCYAWEATTGALLRAWEGHAQGVTDMALTDDGAVLVTAGEDAVVTAWSKRDLLVLEEAGRRRAAARLQSYNGHSESVTAVALGVGGYGTRMVTVSRDESAKVWHLQSGSLLGTVHTNAEATCVALDVMERDAFVGLADGRIATFGLTAWSKSAGTASAYFSRHSGAVRDVALSPTSVYMASCSDDGVFVWDVESRTKLTSYSKHGGVVDALLVVVPKPACFENNMEATSRTGGQAELEFCSSLSRVPMTAESLTGYTPSVVLRCPAHLDDDDFASGEDILDVVLESGNDSAPVARGVNEDASQKYAELSLEVARLREENKHLLAAGTALVDAVCDDVFDPVELKDCAPA